MKVAKYWILLCFTVYLAVSNAEECKNNKLADQKWAAFKVREILNMV